MPYIPKELTNKTSNKYWVVIYLLIAFLCAEVALAEDFFDGAENGLINITADTSPGYNVLSGNQYADPAPHSFHFAHPDNLNQWLILPAVTVPPSGVLKFKSRLAWAGVGQKARVQISSDNGLTWPADNDFSVKSSQPFVQSGSDGAGEFDWSNREVSLESYAGQQVKIRFLYSRDISQTTFSGTADSGNFILGWFVDQIQIFQPGSAPILSEGAESGTSHLSMQTSPGYNALSTFIYADSTFHSFHLTHPDGANQVIYLNATFTPQAGSVIKFKSRLAWSGEGQSARIQVSLDGGATWPANNDRNVSLYQPFVQNGSNEAGESGFNDREINLGFAGQPVKIRFIYTRDSQQTTFSGVSDNGNFIIGWYIDNIRIEGVTISPSLATATATPTRTQTKTVTRTPTNTSTITRTQTRTPTRTFVSTLPTHSATPTIAVTLTPSATPTRAPESTNTISPVITNTPIHTVTVTPAINQNFLEGHVFNTSANAIEHVMIYAQDLVPARTDKSGYFRINGAVVGKTYNVVPAGKFYLFEPEMESVKADSESVVFVGEARSIHNGCTSKDITDKLIKLLAASDSLRKFGISAVLKLEKKADKSAKVNSIFERLMKVAQLLPDMLINCKNAASCKVVSLKSIKFKYQKIARELEKNISSLSEDTLKPKKLAKKIKELLKQIPNENYQCG